MPNRVKRARRRQGGAGVVLPALIALFALVAAVLVILLVRSDPLAPDSSDELPYRYTSPLTFADAGDATPAPLVLGSATEPPEETAPAATDAPTATPAPDAQQTPESTSAAQAGGNRLIPTPKPGDYFLPVFDKALRTPDDRAMIAITIDDCNKSKTMTKIVGLARRYGAKLTLFPTGNALMKQSKNFRTYVVKLGYEIEGRCFDANRMDYSLSSGEMALQIWRQGIAASYAVSKDYQQHFYRPESNESVDDQRTHFFLRKLGLLGIAGYTYSYQYQTLDYLVKTLANGNIYQFDMSDESMALFESFLSEANRKGYKMVTMNELFGLSANTVGKSLTIDKQILPEMDDYTPTYYNLKLNSRTNAVYALQTRLAELGYLIQRPTQFELIDGIYGADTSVAVSEFQARVGLVATGEADVETQKRLFADDAPPAQAQATQPASTQAPSQ